MKTSAPIISYHVTPAAQLADAEIRQCAELFSRNYGTWGESAGARAGSPIKLSASRFAALYASKDDCYIARMFNDRRLVGQVVYLRRPCPWRPRRRITFILQLVIDKSVRGHRLGLRLLQSIFGLSDDEAWGLFTSNPLTIRALEDATFRHIEVARIGRGVRQLRPMLDDVFGDGGKWLDTFDGGAVDTGFPADHSQIGKKISKAYPDGGFPFSRELKPSEEWLAVVFRNQATDFNEENFKRLATTSRDVLRGAFSRMDLPRQGWNSHTTEEVAFLMDGIIGPGDAVLDMGCGNGRHSIALAEAGCRVYGVDFSPELIMAAKDAAAARGLTEDRVSFAVADAQSARFEKRFDVVLCLYDVIGASPDDATNKAIVDTIWDSLKPGGVAIVSVMSSRLADMACRKSANRIMTDNPKELFAKLSRLAPSDIMQKTGEVFSERFLLFDPRTECVYHKEQFSGDGALPVEYAISERRYCAESLAALFRRFKALSIAYVRAGRFGSPLNETDKHAKEVLGIFRKPRSIWG